jgi:hypothetical protein
LEGFSEKGYSGLRDTQYKLDLVADEAVLNVLLAAGTSSAAGGSVTVSAGASSGEASSS